MVVKKILLSLFVVGACSSLIQASDKPRSASASPRVALVASSPTVIDVLRTEDDADMAAMAAEALAKRVAGLVLEPVAAPPAVAAPAVSVDLSSDERGSFSQECSDSDDEEITSRLIAR